MMMIDDALNQTRERNRKIANHKRKKSDLARLSAVESNQQQRRQPIHIERELMIDFATCHFMMFRKMTNMGTARRKKKEKKTKTDLWSTTQQKLIM
jgi:hypothetical protein